MEEQFTLQAHRLRLIQAHRLRRFPERTAPVAVVLAKAPDVDLKSSPSSSIDLDAAMLANRIVITASSFAPQQIEQCASDFRGVDPASL